MSAWINRVKLLLIVARPEPSHIIVREHDSPIIHSRVHDVAAHARALIGDPAEDGAVVYHAAQLHDLTPVVDLDSFVIASVGEPGGFLSRALSEEEASHYACIRQLFLVIVQEVGSQALVCVTDDHLCLSLLYLLDADLGVLGHINVRKDAVSEDGAHD